MTPRRIEALGGTLVVGGLGLLWIPAALAAGGLLLVVSSLSLMVIGALLVGLSYMRAGE